MYLCISPRACVPQLGKGYATNPATTANSPSSLTTNPSPSPPWPLQDIRSLQSFLALVNPPGIAPPACIAHTIAILLHDFWAIYDLPSRPPFGMSYTILYW